MNKQANDNQTINEDLPVSDEQGVAVKGGDGGGYGIILIDTISSMPTVR